MWRSVPQIDAAWTRTRTSPSPGSGTAMSTSSAPRASAVLRSANIVVIAASLPAGAELHAAQDGCAGTVAGRLPSKAATPTDGGHADAPHEVPVPAPRPAAV